MDRLDMLRATTIPLQLSVNVTDDWLEAIEYGSVVDGRPHSQLVEVSPDVRYVLRSARGPVAGFTVHRYGTLSIDALADAAFEGPQFNVPVLGLDHASVGEVIL